MRKTIILSAIATLIGLGAVAQANDRAEPGRHEAATHETVNNDRDAKHDRDAQNEHANEAGKEFAEAHDGNERGERHDRD